MKALKSTPLRSRHTVRSRAVLWVANTHVWKNICSAGPGSSPTYPTIGSSASPSSPRSRAVAKNLRHPSARSVGRSAVAIAPNVLLVLARIALLRALHQLLEHQAPAAVPQSPTHRRVAHVRKQHVLHNHDYVGSVARQTTSSVPGVSSAPSRGAKRS